MGEVGGVTDVENTVVEMVVVVIVEATECIHQRRHQTESEAQEALSGEEVEEGSGWEGRKNILDDFTPRKPEDFLRDKT
ncbi:unnamed protein product [Arctogadus glacialis]